MPTRPSPRSERLGTPNTPAIRFTRDPFFEASLVRICYGLSGCSPPWTDLTELPQPPGAFTSRLPTGWSPVPPLGTSPKHHGTEDDYGASCRFGRVLERDVGLHRGWRGQDHPRDESGLRA